MRFLQEKFWEVSRPSRLDKAAGFAARCRFSGPRASDCNDPTRVEMRSHLWALSMAILVVTALSGCGSVVVKQGSTGPTPGSGTSATLQSVQCASMSIVGSSSDACSVSLTAAAPASGVSVSLSSSNPAVAVPASVTVPAGATSASFTASVTGVTTAQSTTIHATAGGASVNAVLQLGPSAPMLSVNATSVNFGTVVVSTSATESVTLSSTGSEPVTVTAVSVTGTDFTLSGPTLPVTLSPGQNVVLNIAFSPSASGAMSGQLTINSDSASNATATISLSGSGEIAAHKVTLTWNAPASTPVPVAGYNAYRAPTGTTAFQLLNTAEDLQTTYVDYTVQSGLTYDYVVKSVDSEGVESAPSNLTTVTIP